MAGAQMLLESLSRLEQTDSLHLGRLLLILRAMSADSPDHPLQGLTKLAKLDFLIRYPNYLERALEARHASAKAVGTVDYERQSVESAMVRYRFGPWDGRYRRFLNLLSAKGLVRLGLEGRTVVIILTEKGVKAAERLQLEDAFKQLADRAQLLRHFDLSATNLMKFIYETFPEISTLRSGGLIR
jgi:hypothetical protein